MSTDTPKAVLVCARLNARLQPLDRAQHFEDPLTEALSAAAAGEVTGGGCQMSRNGEIACCDIEVELAEVNRGVAVLCASLNALGAPKGSSVTWSAAGRSEEVAVGTTEGLALYLNGTDLPDEVYQKSDVNELIGELSDALGAQGAMLSYWQGPTETALYFYGASFLEMSRRMASIVASCPLCERSRIERIA